jgi:nucleotide-binding universal stress UspA family protein
MYRSICLPLQQSDQQDQALAFAQSLAETFGSEITGIRTTSTSRKAQRRERLVDLLPEEWRPSGAALTVVEDEVDPADDLPFEVKSVGGSDLGGLSDVMAQGDYDLLVLPATRLGDADLIGPLAERLVRRARQDVLIVKNMEPVADDAPIVVCIDGSQEAYGGLKHALELSRKTGRAVEAIAVYDPYLHYTLFNGIVNVLSAEASSVFKFADQEKLHEEIIDTGLAKIYQAHLQVAQELSRDEGEEISITLLDGKAFQKVLRHANRVKPWLLIMGRVGVHSEKGMDVGATTENLLRNVTCDVLISSTRYLPPVDVQAHASVEWTDSARKKMERVPSFVKGVATMSIVRWAIERGHSIITSSIINSAMGDLLPPGAAQAMGYVAEEVAKDQDNLLEGKTFLCPECGYAARDYRPVACPVCDTEGPKFEQIDRKTLEALSELERGSLEEEEMFDGKRLKWSNEAKGVLRRVPSGYERRRAKARIEKTARVRGLSLIGHEFAVDMIEQENADTSYLSKRGDSVVIEVKEDEKPDDAVATPRDDAKLLWTDAAWKRICRVPAGFMRDMTRDKVEEFGGNKGVREVNLELCEEGIAEGRRMMTEMMGQYTAGGPKKQAIRESTDKAPTPKAEPEAQVAAPEEGRPEWTEAAEAKVDAAVERVADAGKFDEKRARDLSVGVTETRAKEKRMQEISESFMAKLGTQLGYGHPLSEKTAEYNFEWTPEAEARLADVPDFCREMTRWRVEWTAVKKELGFLITPEIMDVKFEMWGEVSDAIQARGDGKEMEWDAEPMARLEKIPDFVKGQVIQSVVGNARKMGHERVTNEVLDAVIGKWIDTGDFHETEFGYQ